MRFAVPTLLFLLSLPLIARMVPPNRIYGFRTATALSSEKAWYTANATAGVVLAVAAALWLLWLVAAPRLGLDDRATPWVGPGLLVAALLVSWWATRQVAA